MACAEVCRAISDGDRRVLRGRRVRAHVRDCASCAAFVSAIETRQAELRVLLPVLPAAASAAVLARVVHGGAAGGGIAAGGAGGAAVAGTAGKTVGVAIAGKGVAAASLLATAAVSVGGVAAVMRLSHDGRPAVAASGGHSPVVRTGVRRTSAAGGPRATISVGAAVGPASGARPGVLAKLPTQTTSTRGHGRSASSAGQSGSFAHGQSASPSNGQSASSSYGQSGSASHGHSGSWSHGKSAWSPGHSVSWSHAKSSSSPGHSEQSSPGNSAASRGTGHAKGASSAGGVGKQTASGRVRKTAAATERLVTIRTNRGLGAAKKVRTDLPGSQALMGAKARK
jgi:hypothetical protein